MTKALLIICGGIEAIHGIARAKEMGLHVVVSDGDPNAPGFAPADGRIVASTYDPDGTAEAAARYSETVRRLDGVICMGADVPHTVAAVARRLGLRGLSPETAHLAMDKLAMKDRLKAHGVPIPWYAPVRDAADLQVAMLERGRDLVVKPVDSRGGRGVQRLNAGLDAETAFARAKAQSPTGRVMVEAYLEGPQISTESILLDGVGYTPGFSDRNYEYLDRFAPWFIENGGDLPSHVAPAVRADVEATVTAAAKALGIIKHNYKGDMVVHRGKAHVIEIAARLSGGYFCTREIPLSTGVDFVGAVMRLAIGERVSPADLTPRFERPVVQRYVFPPPGRIAAVRGVDAARALPGVIEVLVSRAPGNIVPVAESSAARAAMILATGATVAEARVNAARAVATIRIDMAEVAVA
jgi:biotin carboxylase